MTVSVGIPFYDSEKTIALAIRSVFAQTHQDWELILADDGSTDRSLEIARAVRNPRVSVLSDGRNRGLQYRLNQLARLARGEYLARMDADDMMHPERLARQIQCLDGDSSFDVVGTAAYTIDAAGDPVGLRGKEPLDTTPQAALKRGAFIHPSVTGRAEWFRNNPYDQSFRGSEDRELWCRTCTRTNFAKLDQPLHYYREDHKAPARFLTSYLNSARHDRRALRIYGPSLIGPRDTAFLILRSFLNAGIYRLATPLGLQGALIRSRDRRLTDSERAAALEGLNIVMRTPVPGLASHA